MPEETIRAGLRQAYGLRVMELAFLPLGADGHTAVYRVSAEGGTRYFLKLRWGTFDETSVALPRFLSDQGIRQIMAPLPTATGLLRADMGGFWAILYPFVEGRDGYAVRLSERQWHEFGAALKQIHTIAVPLDLAGLIRRETYSPRWRAEVRARLGRLDAVVDDPVAARLAAFLDARRFEVAHLVSRAEALACSLRSRAPEFVLCHSDLHAGNLLIGSGGALYIVDWDEPILAPKERDLMFIGGAQGFLGDGAEEEEALFYRGYGPAQIDPVALAYYRYERIVVDLAAFCEQLLATREGGADREQSLGYVMANWAPGGTIERARRADGILDHRADQYGPASP